MKQMQTAFILLLALFGAILVGGSLPLAPTQAAAPQARKTSECTNTVGMKFVYVSPGKFFMGSPKAEQDEAIADSKTDADELATMKALCHAEEPLREVVITRGYYLGVYEVTQAEYKEVVGHNPSAFSALGAEEDYIIKAAIKGLDTSRFPVERVSYVEALDFCKRLGERPAEKKAGRTYRLPTEAEWEYASRAGTRTAFSYGKSLSSAQANFKGHLPFGGGKKGPYLKRPCTVGSYKPNAWGLYDMHGNVSEWCSDWYDPRYHADSGKRDPEGRAVKGYGRVFRGGNWYHAARDCRCATREESKGGRDIWLGFRVLLVR